MDTKQKHTKLLVLDMDGVINSDTLIRKWQTDYAAEHTDKSTSKQDIAMQMHKAYIKAFANCTELVFPELAARVNKIVTDTGCDLLWSSDWRNLPKYYHIEKARDMFNRRGLPGNALIDYTPLIYFHPRSHEINLWLKHNQKYTKVAVLDDLTEAGDNLTNVCKFFQTTMEKGITEDIMNNVIAYLKED